MTRYAFTLPDGEHVTGGVITQSGYLGPGQIGVLRCDLIHAELGLSLVHVLEADRGCALVADPDRQLVRLVPLAGAKVLPA